MLIRSFLWYQLGYPSEARLPEWSKGVDSSSTVQEYSWVQIPQRAFFFISLLFSSIVFILCQIDYVLFVLLHVSFFLIFHNHKSLIMIKKRYFQFQIKQRIDFRKLFGFYSDLICSCLIPILLWIFRM